MIDNYHQQFASSIIAFEGLLAIHQVNDEEAPDAKKSFGSFGPAKVTKEVLINPSSYDGKVVHIGITLSPK
jgi:Tol biopolymer transport system component